MITPLIILGVPVTDTFFAMIRRKTSNMPISMADKQHFTSSLIEFGIYSSWSCINDLRHCRIISFTALLLNYTSRVGTIVLIKNGIGMAGAFIAVLICAVPILQMLLSALLYKNGGGSGTAGFGQKNYRLYPRSERGV